MISWHRCPCRRPNPRPHRRLHPHLHLRHGRSCRLACRTRNLVGLATPSEPFYQVTLPPHLNGSCFLRIKCVPTSQHTAHTAHTSTHTLITHSRNDSHCRVSNALPPAGHCPALRARARARAGPGYPDTIPSAWSDIGKLTTGHVIRIEADGFNDKKSKISMWGWYINIWAGDGELSRLFSCVLSLPAFHKTSTAQQHGMVWEMHEA